MVTELFLAALMTIPTLVLSWLPSLPIPTYLAGSGAGTLHAQLSGAVGSLSGVSQWVPLWAITASVALVAGAMIAAVSIKVIRIVASFLTLGGGSAA